MLLACLLLAIAVLGGTTLTFLFEQSAPRAARLALGASIGLPLLAGFGFLFSLWLGLNAWSVFLSGAVMLLPFLLLVQPAYRSRVLAQWGLRSQTASSRRAAKSGGSNIGYVVFYVAIAVMLGLVFNRAVFERPDGIFTGVENNLGDLPLHFQVINSFAQGQNIPPEDPTYAGVRFAYPFLVDFLAAMLVRAGAGVIGAMWLENMVMALALVGSLHYWTLLLTRNRLAGVIAPLLVLFSGGLGWWLLFSDFGGAEGTFTFLAALPHDYTILREPDTILRWGNSLTTLFVPQRSILFGAPLAILIFCQWWRAIAERGAESATIDNPSPARQKTASAAQRRKNAEQAPRLPAQAHTVAAAICAGMLPLVHAHTFLVVMGVAACLALIFHSMWRGWLLFFAIAIPVSLPDVFWLAHTGGVNTRSYLGWQPGWDHGTHNVLWFWFVNAGPFLLALLAVLFWRGPKLRLPQALIKFYAPFALCFIVPNLIRLAPWVWDNIKVLYWWYIASTPLVALLLARLWQQRSRWRWLAPVALLTMVLAGGLDVLRVVTEATEQQEFTPEGIAIAKIISQQAAPRAVVLHAPTFDTPVFLTGRRSLLGFPAWMWSRGIDYSLRYNQVQSIYLGGLDANDLVRQYGVDYVLVGPAELSTFRVNEYFLSQYKKLAEIGPYRLYQVNKNAK
jgi:hypothetical protein